MQNGQLIIYDEDGVIGFVVKWCHPIISIKSDIHDSEKKVQ